MTYHFSAGRGSALDDAPSKRPCLVVSATHEPDEDRIREALRILLRGEERAKEGQAA